MRNPVEWEEADLTALISAKVEENTIREFKRGVVLEDLDNRQLAEKRKEQISIDVSAFANRAGGIIIYGIEEEDAEPHAAVAMSPIDPAKCSKERLEQIINSRIRPPLQAILIRPIALGGLNSGKVVYVVKIPQSFTVHQASDKRYYRRANFMNQMMEDDEVRQAMNRARKPIYAVSLHTVHEGRDAIRFHVTVQNRSDLISHEVSAILLIPEGHTTTPTPYGTETIENIVYSRVLSDHHQVRHDLPPFAMLMDRFKTTVTVTDPPPAQRFQAIVRVFDQFGRAAEAEYSVSMISSPLGVLSDETLHSREEMF